jgi:hypothetical protein
MDISTHHRFSNCSPTVDVGFAKLKQNSSVETESSSFKNIQFCCHLECSSSVILRRNPSWRTATYLFLSISTFARCSSSLMLSSHYSCVPTLPLNTAVNVTGGLYHRRSYLTRTNDLPSFKIRQISYFTILSHGRSLDKITNARTRPLHSLDKHKFYSLIS